MEVHTASQVPDCRRHRAPREVVWPSRSQSPPDAPAPTNLQSWNGKVFTKCGDGSFIVSGYEYVLQLSTGGRPDIKVYPQDTEKKVWLKTLQEKNAAARELVIDSTMGVTNNANTKYGRNFVRIYSKPLQTM